jgi:hypothetical protein
MVRFRDKGIFVVGFWWLLDISYLPLILTTSLTNLVCPKPFTILTLICLDHYPQLRLMTPTTNPSFFSTHHSQPASDPHNVQVPDYSSM